jgi:hypothetical protein
MKEQGAEPSLALILAFAKMRAAQVLEQEAPRDARPGNDGGQPAKLPHILPHKPHLPEPNFNHLAPPRFLANA